MAVAVKVFTVATTDSGAKTLDFGVSGTSKAIMFFPTNGASEDVEVSILRIAAGFATASAEASASIAVADGNANSDTYRYHSSSTIRLLQAGGAYYDFDAQGDGTGSNPGPISGGWRVSVNTAPSSADCFMVAVLFYGDDITSVSAGTLDDLGTGTSAVSINTGFVPNLVFVTGVGLGTVPPAETAHAIWSFGVMSGTRGAEVQHCQFVASTDAQAATQSNNAVYNNRLCGQVFSDAASWLGTGGILSTGSGDSVDGFSVTPSASAGSDIIFYLAIATSDTPRQGDLDSPTSSGTWDVNGPANTPQFAMVVGTPNTAYGSIASAGSPTMAGFIGVSDGSNTGCMNWRDQDAAADTVAKSRYSANLARLIAGDGTDYHDIGGPTFDSGGWTATVNGTPDSTARKWFYLTVDAAVAAGGGLKAGSLSQMGVGI